MLLRTHLIFNFLIFLIFVKTNIFELNIITFLLVFLATSLPDIDIVGSWISKITKPASNLVHIFVAHREFLHSLTFILIISVVLFLLRLGLVYVGIFTLFYILHLFLDSLTKSGIRWFWPSRFKIKGFIKTGGFLEAIFFFILILAIIFLILISL
jgi:inner membrane protein